MQLVDILVCDDIRLEINNKVSLMGLYNDRLIFSGSPPENKEPVMTKLSVLFRFKFDDEEKTPNKFEFEYFHNDKSLGKLNGVFQSAAQFSMANLIINIGVPLQPGDLGFSIKLFAEMQQIFSEKKMAAMKILGE